MDQKELIQYEKLAMTPISKLIPRLSVPTVISMMISMIYNLVDAYFVGRLGTSASGAIGILLSVSTVFQAVGFMHGHGSGSLISMRLGTGDHDAATRFASRAFFGAAGISIFVATLGLIFVTPLMKLLGSTDTILPFARTYGIYILIAGPAVSTSCVLNNIMRYEGKAVLAMVGLVSGGVLNMICDPIFMFGLKMGIAGAGLATAMSQYISLGLLYYMFASGRTISRIRLGSLKDGSEKGGYGKILKTGLPSLVRQLMNSLAAMTLNVAARPYGDAAIAAMAIVGRVGMFVGSAMIGIGQGFQPVAAYNYGAKKYRRVKDGFKFTVILGELVLGALAVLCLIYPEKVVAIFRDDPDVLAVGARALRFQSIAVLVQPFPIVSTMFFQSIAKSKEASILSSLRSGVYYIPILIILPKFLGILGIQSAQMIADILAGLTILPITLLRLREMPDGDEPSPVDEKYRKAKGLA